MTIGRSQEAAKLLEDHWSQLAAWPDAVHIRARVLDQLGEPEQAVTLLKSSLRVHPEVADNWLELGQLQNQLRQYAQAESSLRTAVGLGMTANETLIFALSTSVGRQNRTEEATKLRELFQELKKTSADPSGNRFQDAYSSALRKIAARAMLNTAALYTELGNTQRAEQIVMQLLALDPNHVTALMTLSAILRRTDRLPDAFNVQKRVLELEPGNPLNVINLASVMIDLGSLSDAEALLKDAATKSPPNAGLLHAELARVYLNLERFAEARTFARQAVDRQPIKNHYTLLAAACKALDDKGGLFEAVSAIERLERTPVNSRITGNTGNTGSLEVGP
jgi:predicted Zn-dependent protease